MPELRLNPSLTTFLSAGEVAASGAKSLSAGAQRALVAAALAGHLTGTRSGWHTPAHPRPIARRTVAMLVGLGVMLVSRRGAVRQARLTALGKWYARTLCSAIKGEAA